MNRLLATQKLNLIFETLSLYPFIAYCLVFLFCYSPVLMTQYGFSDDYMYLAGSYKGHLFPLKSWPGFVASGRPLFTLLWFCYSFFINKVADFALLRLFGILSLALLSFCIYKTMLAAGWNKKIAFSTATIIGAMPSFQVYVCWSTISPTIILMVIAGVAVYLASKSYAEINIKWKYLLWLSSVITQLIALAVTQCNPMFYWIFVSIILFKLHAMPSDYLKRFFWYLSVFMAACALDFGIAQVGKTIYGTQQIAIERSHLTHDLCGKIIWFFSEPLTNALNFGWLFPNHHIAALTGIIILIGLGFYFRWDLIKLLIALCIIPLCYFPNLAIAENFASYRTIGALSSILILYALFALKGFYQAIFRSKYNSMFEGFIILLSIISICSAYYNVFTYFVLPQTFELKLLKAMSKKNVCQSQLFDLWGQLFPVADIKYDEFACPSMDKVWIRGPLTRVVQQESF